LKLLLSFVGLVEKQLSSCAKTMARNKLSSSERSAIDKTQNLRGQYITTDDGVKAFFTEFCMMVQKIGRVHLAAHHGASE